MHHFTLVFLLILTINSTLFAQISESEEGLSAAYTSGESEEVAFVNKNIVNLSGAAEHHQKPFCQRFCPVWLFRLYTPEPACTSVIFHPQPR